MTLFTPSNPVRPGQPEDAKQLQDTFAEARTLVNGQLGGDQFPVAGIPDSMQAQPTAPVWRRVYVTNAALLINDLAPAGTWFVFTEGAAQQNTGGGYSRGRDIAFFHANPAGYQLPGRKTLMRFGVALAVNAAAASAVDFTFLTVNRGAGFSIGDVLIFWDGARPVLNAPALAAGQVWSGVSGEFEFSPATFATTVPGSLIALAMRRTSGGAVTPVNWAMAEAWFEVRWVPA